MLAKFIICRNEYIMKATSLTGIQRHDKLKAESVTGGAGEGSQLLRPDSDFEEREKVSLFPKGNTSLC